jgi:hypothetical protein
MVAAVVGIASVAATAYSADQQSNAAENAANTQAGAAQAGIDAQNSRFQQVQQLLAPYAQAGTQALTGQQNLIGLNGNDAQRSAIDQLQNSSQFQALARQGENGILQNASATGGLRGGNVQGALGQFRPAMLSALIDQQYSRLGGLTSLGQNAAAGVGNAGMQTGNQVTSLLQQQGAAMAGGQLAQGRAQAGYANAFANGLGVFGGLGGFGGGQQNTAVMPQNTGGQFEGLYGARGL